MTHRPPLIGPDQQIPPRNPSEGHACRARRGEMGHQSVFIGRDKHVPPKGGPDKRVPPRGGPDQQIPPRNPSEGHACRARRGGMGHQSVFIGRDKHVPPKGGPDKQVPPRGGPDQQIPPRNPSEGHACRARGKRMGRQSVFIGRDKHVPPICGFDRHVPPALWGPFMNCPYRVPLGLVSPQGSFRITRRSRPVLTVNHRSEISFFVFGRCRPVTHFLTRLTLR